MNNACTPYLFIMNIRVNLYDLIIAQIHDLCFYEYENVNYRSTEYDRDTQKIHDITCELYKSKNIIQYLYRV